jgi:predicted ATPase/DNA-binding CsgD family transcriptional regulator
VTQEATRISEREAEVLAALGEHLSNQQIASRLHLSVRTVETHVSSLLRKLGAADRRALASLAPGVHSAQASGGAGAVRGLPAAWTPFVGRRRERDELVEALGTSRLVTLLGPGGVGKTRLAAEVARELAPTMPLGVTFVELVSARPGFLLQTVAAVLGVSERPGLSLREAVLAQLRSGRSLLVLDNCEHLVDDTAEFVSALLAEATDLRVLTTSRARIGVAGERVLPLFGLSLVAPSTGGPAGSDAVSLFFDRARTLDARFDADPVAVGELCAQLDGMPLAIELATARSAALGVAGLRAGLSDRLRLLTGGHSGDERHRSLRAVLDWSHDLLDEEEQAALRRLGRFAGDFDLAAASAVTDMPPAVVADLVGRLADQSLIVHRPDGQRWSLLETVRVYALERLADADELTEVTNRYVGWAVDSAAGIEARLDAGDSWRTEFDGVADDLRAALGLVEGEQAARLARLLGHLAFARRFMTEARGHYLRAAAATSDDGQAARDLWMAAGIAQSENDGTTVYELGVAASERAAAAGDLGMQATVLAEAVSVATRFPAVFVRDIELNELQEMLARAHELAPDDDPAVTAQLLAADAWTQTRLVDLPQLAPFTEALDAAERSADPLLISAALDALGSVQIMHGHLAKTHELGARRLGLLSTLSSHQPRAGSEIHDILHMGVENAVSAGEISFALETAQRFTDEDVVAASPLAVYSKPVVPLMLMGRFDEAIALGERTRAGWEAAGRPAGRWLAPAMYSLVLCHALLGNDDAANEWREFAIEVAGEQTRIIHIQVGGMIAFVETRLALHFGHWSAGATPFYQQPIGDDAWQNVRHWYFDAYPWAAAAEFAAAAGHPDAPERLRTAEPAARENPFAAGLLARAHARLTGDPAHFQTALDIFEKLEARFERAATLALMPSRLDEARSEFHELGVPMPQPAP